MRVIAGKFRSRPLRSLHGLDVRPTSDRLRETLFDVLTAGNPSALVGSVWVDLFAGTGAVGLEALSRGAQMVYFVESSRRVADLIEANLKSLRITGGFVILHQKALPAIADLERLRVAPNFIFFDPPYRMKPAYRETLERLAESPLGRNTLIIAEHEKRFEPGEVFRSLRRERKLQQGDAALSFYRSE
jgi:16S rRNA (guanine966-N2)-methyltransferase